MEYLDLPIKFEDLKLKKDTRRVDVKQSIHNMIHLITTTAYNEVSHDPEFGSEIWVHDFENIYNPHAFKEKLKKSLQNSIKNHEKRLVNVSIDFQVEQVEITTRVKNKRIKTRIKLVVNGVIEKTNEAFGHQEMFFIGPLSY
jgi:phage baseplate assembly protein W